MSQHQWDRDGERCLKCGDKDWLAGSVCYGRASRPCTCHPDDNPPIPCQKKYALTECKLAAAQTRIAELEAWIAWLEVRIVDVRTPAMWGSHHEFTAQPSDDCAEGEEVGPSNLRDLLRGALARKP